MGPHTGWPWTVVIPITTLLLTGYLQNLQNRLYIHDEQGRSMQVVFTENYKLDYMLSSCSYCTACNYRLALCMEKLAKSLIITYMPWTVLSSTFHQNTNLVGTASCDPSSSQNFSR